MEIPAAMGGQLFYQEYDRISIPEDVPALGIEKGDDGVYKV